MTIEQPDRVDSITRSADGATYTLLMTEDRRLDGSDAQLNQLLEKINAYIGYIQLGQFHQHYPDAVGRGLRVRLVCRDEPTDERYRNLLKAGAQLFAKHGAEFGVEVIPPELVGGR